MERTMIPENLKKCRFCKKDQCHVITKISCVLFKYRYFELVDEIKEYGKAMYESGKIGELICDGCGCHPGMTYTSEKGRFCNQCKPK